MKKLLMMSLLATLTACGGGSGDGGGDFTSGGSASKLVGMWNATTDEGEDGIDENYLAIDSDGFVSLYDYDGDTYDDGENCYWIEEDVAELKALGDDRYRVVQEGSSDTQILIITVQNNTMTIAEEGDEEDFSTLTRSSIPVSDFTPECSDSFEDARALIPAKKAKISKAPYFQ